MRITDAMARLERAGDENSKAWQKLREAVDQFAEWLAKILPGGGQVNQLPWGYTFAHWPSKEYRLGRMDGPRRNTCLTQNCKDVRTLVAFSQEIHDGLLDDISRHLEIESAFLERITAKLSQQTQVQ